MKITTVGGDREVRRRQATAILVAHAIRRQARLERLPSTPFIVCEVPMNAMSIGVVSKWMRSYDQPRRE